MSTRLDQAKEAMKAIENQDYEPAMALVAPNYKHHSTRGIEVTGPEEFREILVPQLEQIRLVQRLETIIESGEFVVATVRATSTLREGESSMVYVFRYEDDRIAEAWAISPPVGTA